MPTIALVGAGAAGAALAVELVRRGCRDIVLFDADPGVREAFVRSGGLAFDGFCGAGLLADLRWADSLEEAVAEADCVVATITSDRHQELGRQLAPFVRSQHLIVLHTGYVGGCRVLLDGLREGGCASPPHLAETINTLHLAGARGPCDVFIKGRKRWLEITGLTPEATRRALERLSPAIPELAPGRCTLETGLNNPNPIGHVPALVGNLGLLGRDLGTASQGMLQFDELRSTPVQALCEAFDRERTAVMEALGLAPAPIAEFIPRAYGPQDRLSGALPRFGTKLLPRFFDEDVAAACVPIESLGQLAGTSTPVTTSLIDICDVAARRSFRQEGRTVATLGSGWIDSELRAVRS